MTFNQKLMFAVALICLASLPSLVLTTKVQSTVSPSNSQPVILTPYIEANETSLAKSLSSISRLPSADVPDFVGYSGYLTVNESCNGNLFFFFLPNLVSGGQGVFCNHKLVANR